MIIRKAVFTIPQREALAWQLFQDVQGSIFSVDKEGRGPWWNARQCWKALRDPQCGPADWALLLDDDAIVGPQFNEQLERMLSAAVEKDFHAVNLFTCGKYDMRKVDAARAEGAQWVVKPGAPGVASCIRTQHIPALLEFAARYGHEARDSAPQDILMYRFIGAAGLKHGLALPMIVDHPDDLPSTTEKFRGMKNMGRTNPFYEPDYEGNWGGHEIDVLPARLEVRLGQSLECKLY